MAPGSDLGDEPPGAAVWGGIVSVEDVTRKSVERRWFVALGLSWLFLSLFDLGITFWALAVGRASEANPIMAPIIHAPLLATSLRLTFVYIALKAAEAICLRTRFSSIPILAIM